MYFYIWQERLLLLEALMLLKDLNFLSKFEDITLVQRKPSDILESVLGCSCKVITCLNGCLFY